MSNFQINLVIKPQSFVDPTKTWKFHGIPQSTQNRKCDPNTVALNTIPNPNLTNSNLTTTLQLCP